MHPNRPALWASLLACVVLCACSATKARINDHEDLFNSYPPEVQAYIRSNRIDRGFDKTQVYLALGQADRTESAQVGEVWYYHETQRKSVKEEKSAGEYRDELATYEKAVAEGRDVNPPTTYRTTAFFRTRIEREVRFEDGRVTGWDEPGEAWLDDWHR